MKGIAGAPCTRRTGSPEGLERNIWKWVTGRSSEKDKIEMKLLVRFLCCSISNIAVNLLVNNSILNTGFRQKYFPLWFYSLFLQRFTKISHYVYGRVKLDSWHLLLKDFLSCIKVALLTNELAGRKMLLIKQPRSLSGENDLFFSHHNRFPLCSLVGRCCPTGIWKRAGSDPIKDTPIGQRS